MIERRGQLHGPLSAEDLRSYVSYGSVSISDNVWLVEEEQWLPLNLILCPPEPEHEAEESHGWRSRWMTCMKYLGLAEKGSSQPLSRIRRRVVRYRDYQRVPPKQRAGVVMQRMLLGTVLYPPWLWSACATLFSQWVFRRSTDENGYLKVLHPYWEMLGAALLAINTLLIVVLSLWLVSDVWPFLQWCWQEVQRSLGDLLQGGVASPPAT